MPFAVFLFFSFVFDSLSVVVVLCSYAPRIVLSLSPSHRSLVPVLRVNYSIPLSSAVISNRIVQPIAINALLPVVPCASFHRLRVSLILGADGVSSDAAMTGGLVASGEGTWSELLCPKPRELLRLGVSGGGLPAAAAACAGVAGGCAPELNSAQRGHLRFVSASEKKKNRRGRRKLRVSRFDSRAGGGG